MLFVIKTEGCRLLCRTLVFKHYSYAHLLLSETEIAVTGSTCYTSG